MTLTPGDRVGPYEVIALIGRGGMGEVYRAGDHRLAREVALKVISSQFALDPPRRARFEREARLLATLNHPGIATLYGLEEAAGVQALVLELVEGETLAERLAVRPRGLDVAEALTIAQQIAAGLDAAHEAGIVHRDLKPANIALRPDGLVKLLDFGLARAFAPPPDGANAGEAVTTGETSAGTVLGTLAYMSPEQSRGHPTDKRTDIWAFGCVLYEMLTGRGPFEGQTASDTVVAILSGEPDWQRLPAALPAPILSLLRRCLQKDPRQRLRDIGDARIELDAVIAARTSPPRADGPAARGTPTTRHAGLPLLASAAAAGALVALTLTAFIWSKPDPATSVQSAHMAVLLPPGVTVARGPGRLLSLALSPDGRTLVVAATDASGQRLYARPIDRPEATPIPGTDGALAPFFSPDGAWIGYFADRRLKRVPATGGPSVEITDAPGYPAGGSWGPSDRIVFASGYLSPLRVVQASGGPSSVLTKPPAGFGHQFPDIMPDGRTVLFNEGSWIHAVDMDTGRQVAVTSGTVPRYTTGGHLLLRRGTALLAAPFDATRLELTGPVVPVVEGVAIERAAWGAPHVAVSGAGALAYVPAAQEYALVVIQKDGSERVLSTDPLVENPRFSPDGTRLVAARTRRIGEAPDLWMYEIEGGAAPSRLTTDGGRAPVWTRDGAFITYSRPVSSEGSGIYSRPADGSGEARPHVLLSSFHWLVGWTPQGTLTYGMMEETQAEGSSILAFENHQSRHIVGPGDTWGGRLSPDGRWLAYYSLDSGYFEVHVTPFPGPGHRAFVAEGTDPSWSPDGSELYYRSGSRLMAARIEVLTGFRVPSRRLVFEPFLPPLYDDYDIHPDTRTLALVRPVRASQEGEVTVVLNWLAALGPLTRQ